MHRGLLLLGHGSQLNPCSSAPVYAHAERLQARREFAQVAVAFWKEEPSLARGLDALDCPEVVAVPVFISQGYFTEQVIPRELRLTGPRSLVDGHVVWYTPPVGRDPRLAAVAAERAAEAGATRSSSVVILGHGTARNPNSERNVYAQAARVRALNRFHEVATVFLDQEPRLGHVWTTVTGNHIVVVPLFMADGWHVGQTIPEDLILSAGEHHRGDRRLVFGSAVGTHPLVADVISALAHEIPIPHPDPP
jgi:sirohydrochlorin cobaltochelatase